MDNPIVSKNKEIVNLTKPVRLNLGCGANLKIGFLNIDGDTKEEIARRYRMSQEEKNKLFSGPDIFKWDFLNLPISDNSVSEILCEAVAEHLSFEEERLFWKEAQRVIEPGGRITIVVPNFDELAKMWVVAKDDFREFWRSDAKEEDGWFGQGNRNMDNKWGYLTACIFGNQASSYQFHKTAYTKGKFIRICELLNFKVISIENDRWRGKYEPTLKMVAQKL